MNVIDIFLEFHKGKGLPPQAIDRLFDRLSEEQLRCRPHPAVNSVAWVVWHIARAEDVGVNRFVVDGRQVLDEANWQEKLRIANRDHGGGMPDAEVTTLSQQIDLPALRAYYNAVRARTVAVVKTLTPAQLDEVPDTAERLRIVEAEGIIAPTRTWSRRPYPEWRRGELLIHLALTHNYGHFYEVCTICSLMGVEFWG